MPVSALRFENDTLDCRQGTLSLVTEYDWGARYTLPRSVYALLYSWATAPAAPSTTRKETTAIVIIGFLMHPPLLQPAGCIVLHVRPVIGVARSLCVSAGRRVCVQAVQRAIYNLHRRVACRIQIGRANEPDTYGAGYAVTINDVTCPVKCRATLVLAVYGVHAV